MKIVFFPQSNFNLPASRYRAYYVAEEMEKLGIDVKIVHSVFPSYSVKFLPRQIYLYIKNLFRKFWNSINSDKNDFLFIQRGIHQYGFYHLILILKKIFNKKIVFDFDDAIFLQNHEKAKDIIKISDAVIVGSHYLMKYAKKYNKNVYLIPTSVDTKKYMRKTTNEKRNIIIGWIGLPVNIKYLTEIKGALESLGNKYNIELRIITDPSKVTNFLIIENINTNIVPWSLTTEWEEISKFDIGIMPLYNTEWEKGKCAFKGIQYMNMGVPTVASAVGENQYLIEDGKNGYLVFYESEWKEKLERLIKHENLRKNMGIEARKTIEMNYDIQKNTEKLLKIIKNLR